MASQNNVGNLNSNFKFNFKTPNGMTDNAHRVKESKILVEKFEIEKEPERLREAYVLLNGVNLENEKNPLSRIQLRTAALLQWLNLLQTIDNYLDPKFNEDEGVPMHVYSPFDGDADLSGNPEAMEKYKKAEEENTKKQMNYRLQVQLARLNESIPPLARAFIRKNYTVLPPDQAELRSSIEKMLKNKARKDDFLTLLVPLPGIIK